MPIAPCPDCGAAATGGNATGWHMVHEDACPQEAARDRAYEADKEWFINHPRVAERRRRVTPPEANEMRQQLGFKPRKVLVTPGANGMISRGYINPATGRIPAIVIEGRLS